MGLKSFRGDVYFLNTTSADFDDGLQPGEQREPPYSETEFEAGNHGEFLEWTEERPHWAFGLRHLSALPSREAGSSHLFDFFVTSVCPNLSNSEKENPYRDFVVPLSLSSTPLFHALLSWAATEVSFTDHAKKYAYSLVAADYKGRALRGLRREIDAAQRDPSAASTWASILATIILLSAHDIAETCSPAWIEHLSAARHLCQMVWPDRPAAPDRFRAFVIMWFASHDILSRTAWVRKTLFDPGEWFAGDDDTEIDPIVACSRGVIQQISAVGSLILDVRSGHLRPDQAEATFKTRRNVIEEHLHSLRQRVSSGSDAADELLQVAESKRLCALIYLYACVDNATPSSPVIQGLTRRVMAILADLPPKPSIIYPLFVVGTLGVCNEDDRRLVLDKFHSLIRTRCLATAVKARNITVDVWLERDMGRYRRWEDLVETKSKLLSLA